VISFGKGRLFYDAVESPEILNKSEAGPMILQNSSISFQKCR